MAQVTPRHKRLAVADPRKDRAASTPPKTKSGNHLLLPLVITPGSRHSSPGFGRYVADDLIPRRLTVSPVASTKFREGTRKRLSQYHSIDDAVSLLQNAKNIVVLTGAGISTSLDIPDFRSSGGFYSKLSSDIGLSTAEEFFSLRFFTAESESFWDNVKPLLPDYVRAKDGAYQFRTDDTARKRKILPKFSKAHAFLSLLHAKNKLLTNYTQNIDNLERASGVSDDRIVKCHGSWESATCLTCRKTIPARKYLPIVWEGGYPRCSCAGKPQVSPSKDRKRAKSKKRKRTIYEGDSDHSSDNGTSIPKGLFKPDITFFGEALSDDYAERIEKDMLACDIVLVIGTSLKVRPVRTMVVDFPAHVPQIWINKDRFNGYECDLRGVQFDIELIGDCDTVVSELCRRAKFSVNDFLWTDVALSRSGEPTEHLLQVRNATSNLTSLPASKKADDKAISDTAPPSDTQTSTENTNDYLQMRDGAEQRNTSAPQEDAVVHVEADLDAEWRWRFSKKRTLSTTSK